MRHGPEQKNVLGLVSPKIQTNKENNISENNQDNGLA